MRVDDPPPTVSDGWRVAPPALPVARETLQHAVGRAGLTQALRLSSAIEMPGPMVELIEIFFT